MSEVKSEMGKIQYVEASKASEVAELLHPLVREWFFGRFEEFSLTQLYGVKAIHERKNVLVTAPTGGTKTLTAFLSILNYLVELAVRKELEEKMYAVYVSPLKALSSDISINLITPLQEIKALAEKKKIEMQEIRVGLRTGDTDVKERARQARKVPHIYVTTPESLAIVVSSPKFSEKLKALEFVIVDEIHAMLNKRGVFLSLTLENVCEMSVIEPVRIGLSATIAPLEEIARFLVGMGRECCIADVPMIKGMDLGLEYPGETILEAENVESQHRMYHLLDELIQQHRTTLIFTNTRNATERIVYHLRTRFPGKYEGFIGAHHSSMSKEKRFEIEERLRKGELKVVVSSTSLELGIDIGHIDLVVMLRSPKSIARALQRCGRAGHQLHAKPKGRFIVLDRDDLVECSVLMKGMIEKAIDRAEIPRNCLDVLAQQVYGMAIRKVWDVEEMIGLVRKSYCYATLTREDFLDVVSYLAGEYALEHRHVYAKIWYDEKEKKIGRRGKLARVIYLTNLGTIPEEGAVQVAVGQGEDRGVVVGKIDEAFLERLKRGDVFVLGGHRYEFLRSQGMKAWVKANVSKQPTIPSWFSEMLPLSFDAAQAIGRLRKLVGERLGKRGEAIEFLQEYLYCTKRVAEEVYDYCKEQQAFAELPHERLLMVEEFDSEEFQKKKRFVVFHSCYGRRVNDVLARAYAYAAGRLRHRDVEIGVSDHGFFLAAEELNVERIIKVVSAKNVRELVSEAVERTDVLKRRFRHCAARAMMILRSYKGREKSVGRQQVHSEFLISAVRKASQEFPILREARREVLEDVMDIHNAEQVLRWIEEGNVKVKKIRTPLASPFALNLMLQGRSDLIKMEDRASFLKRMHELHLKVIEGKGYKEA